MARSKAKPKSKTKTKSKIAAKGKIAKPKAAKKSKVNPKLAAKAKEAGKSSVKAKPKPPQTSAKAKPNAKLAAKKAKPADKQRATSSLQAQIARFTPLYDRLVLAVERYEKTAGGLFIPSTVSDDSLQRGKVLAVGRGKKSKKGSLRPLDVKVGDVVLFANYSGTSTELNGTEVFILREEDVLGIVS